MTLFLGALYPSSPCPCEVFSASAKIVVTSSASMGGPARPGQLLALERFHVDAIVDDRSGRSIGSACSSTRISRFAMRSSTRPFPY